MMQNLVDLTDEERAERKREKIKARRAKAGARARNTARPGVITEHRMKSQETR